MDDQNVAIRLKGFIDSLGLSYSQFADECKIPRPSLSQLLSGRNKKISDVLVGQIHRVYPDLSVLWLLFGEGPMIVTSASSGRESSKDSDAGPAVDSLNSTSREQFYSDDLKIMEEGACKSEYQNVEALITPSNAPQNIDRRLIDAENRISELQMQIDKMSKFPRKVTQITVYYDDSTFETFLPSNQNLNKTKI